MLQTSWPCATNPMPTAPQIFLPLGGMAAANTKEHTFLLCAHRSLHPKVLLSLPNTAASQTARDAVAVPRTEFHALCKCFGKNCTNPFTDGTRVDDEEEDDDALNALEFKSHLMRKHLYMYIGIMHDTEEDELRVRCYNGTNKSQGYFE